MTIDYAVASYTWIPRNQDINGKTGNPSVDMQYLQLGANRGWVFYSDTPALAPPAPVNTGQPFFQLILPPWFPQKALITRVLGTYSGGVTAWGPSDWGCIVMWIDPKGVSYETGGDPPGTLKGAEFRSDMTRQKQMMVFFGYGQTYGVQIEKFETPFLLDRTVGDKLVFQVSATQPLSSVGAVIDFLIPNTAQPAPPGSGY